MTNTGKAKPVLVLANIIKEDTKVVAHCFTFRDISIDIRERVEKEKLLKQLAEAEKMARVDLFSSTIAHELNNPLDIIQSKIYFLKKNLEVAIMGPRQQENSTVLKISQYRTHPCRFKPRFCNFGHIR